MRLPSIFPLTALLLFVFPLLGCGRGPRPGPPRTPTSRTASSTAAVAAADFVPQVREGFEVSKWADVPNARSLAVSPDGNTVFAGSRNGWVSKISITDGKPKVETFQEKLNGSNGVCFVGDDLIIAGLVNVWRFSAEAGFEPGVEGKVILDNLPAATHHGWRYIRQGPDGRLRMSIGAPCNVCEQEDPRFATICSFTTEGKEFQIEAKGVRNSVGFDWHPTTGEFYFTDNGRDMLGDDIPPCELNKLEEKGSHFGFPYFWGDNQPDPKFGEMAPDLDFVTPITKFQAHVAPLGCYFPKTEVLQKALPGQVVVAQHGSWNRSSPVGYRVVTVDLERPDAEPEPLLWGFLDADDPNLKHGRPVDMTELPDGTLLVSDDHAGVIWAVRAK